MIIRDVEVVNLRLDFDDGGFECAEGRATGRVTSLVRVTVDEGLVGWGAAYSHPDLVRLVVEGHLAPFLIGEDATDVEGLWRRMYGLTQWYGRKGGAISALGAVDIALWDLKGKAAGKPLYALLGGAEPSVEAYASGLQWQDDLRLLQDEARRHIADGFTTMKMRLGRDPEYDRQAVAAVHEAIAHVGRVAVDGTHQYGLDEAVRFGEVLEAHDVAWFEEPFPPEDLDAYVALRQRTNVPVAAGENEFGFQGFRELLRAGAVDVAQPDASRTGGITELIRIVRLAAEHGARVVTHTWSDPVALLANAHVVAALAPGGMVEYDRTGNRFMAELGNEALRVSAGRLALPDRPGLGIEIDPAFLEACAVAAGTPVRDGNYSDLVFGREFRPVSIAHSTNGGDEAHV